LDNWQVFDMLFVFQICLKIIYYCNYCYKMFGSNAVWWEKIESN
jgi:hypothetical protein